jgi:hypothetical protein
MADESADGIIQGEFINPGDVEMGEEGEENGSVLSFAESGPDGRTQFITHLMSPVIALLVGSGEAETIFTAHQALLTKSPFFKDACATFTKDGSVSPPQHPLPVSIC